MFKGAYFEIGLVLSSHECDVATINLLRVYNCISKLLFDPSAILRINDFIMATDVQANGDTSLPCVSSVILWHNFTTIFLQVFLRTMVKW